MRQACSLTLGQCSQAVKMKIGSISECEQVETNEHLIGLLKIFNELMHKPEDTDITVKLM